MNKLTTKEKKSIMIVIIAILALLLVRIFYDPLHTMYDQRNHVAIHTILEFLSITISFSIFIYGWLTFRYFKSQRLVVIGIIFLAVGLFDLLHTLTFPGMPYLISESSTQKTISFWLVARFTEAFFMLIILLSSKRKMEEDRRTLLFTIVITYVSSMAFVIYQFEHSLPIWFIEGQGTTQIKNGIEYFISFLHLLAIVIAVTNYSKTRNLADLYLSIAFFFLLVCELIFTMYRSAYDFNIFLGHLYKVVGYYFILKGFYFSAIDKPFSRTKLIKDTLTLTQQQFKATLDHTADAIVMVDLNRHFIHVNPTFERIFGYSATEVIGKKTPIIPENRSHEFDQLFQKANTGVPVIDFETERQKKDGTLINVSVTLSPIKNDVGEVTFYSSIIRDISHRKQTEEILIKSEKLSVVGQLSAGFAHEIRNPLTTIKGFVQLIAEDSPENHKLYIHLIQSELDRIELITNEFMAVAKPQAVQYKEANILEIISGVTRFMDPQALMYNVQVSTFVEGEIPLVTCEANQLTQVFINLLKNAIEAMPKGGNVVIKLTQKDEVSISISFTDQGCGIPAELLPRLGEPFYTLKEKGTGLGLMVSFKIIEEHHGAIEIDTKVNQGTTFTITLPVNPLQKQ